MGLLDALGDEDFRAGVGRGLIDAGNRGFVGGLLGAPVDIGTSALNLGIAQAGYLGHKAGLLADPLPLLDPKNMVGSSEWFGQKMQDGGYVLPDRNPTAEALSAFALPIAGAKVGRALPLLDADALGGLLASRPGSPSTQVGAIFPAGKARLLRDLQAGQGSGRYPLGDVTEGQGKGLDALFGRPSPSRDVYMTDGALQHLIERRMLAQGRTPEEVAQYAEQAMASRAKPDLDVAKGAQNPALVQYGLIDPATKRRYDARMPLKATDDGYDVRSVIPEGLRPRSDKPPQR